MKKLWQFRFRNIPFSAWLYRIANNEINYFFRKQKHRTLSLETLLEEKNFEPEDSKELLEELKNTEKEIKEHQDFLNTQKKLLNLPLKYQEVITLKYLEQKKIREISQILGKKENTIKSLLKRGMVLLKKEIQYEKIMQPISPRIISEGERT